ncbi:ester cyclase [Roseiflexus sp.]
MPDNNEHHERLAHLAAGLTAAWNAHDPQAVAALCAADYEGENVGEATPHYGPAGMAVSVATYLQAFPDLRFTVDDVVIEGERVVQVWRAHATHCGPLLNIPASGRTVQVRGVSLLTFRDDKLWRALYIWDMAGLLRTIGLLPDL